MKYLLLIILFTLAILAPGAEKPDEKTIGKWKVDDFNELLTPMKFEKVNTGRIIEIEISETKFKIITENQIISPVSTIFIRADKYCWAACVWMNDKNDAFQSEQFQMLFGFDGKNLQVMQMIDGKKTDIKYQLSKIEKKIGPAK